MQRLWEESPPEGWHSWVEGTIGLMHLSSGDLVRAAAHLDGLRALPTGVVPGFQNYYYIGPAIAWFDLERGDIDAGIRFCTELIERFDAEETNRFSAEMRYWRGRLLARHHTWPGAIGDFRRALDLLDHSGARAVQWPIHASLADALVAVGDRPPKTNAGPLAPWSIRSRRICARPSCAISSSPAPRSSACMADLAAVLPGTLERLEARQLIRALVEVEPAFTFKHNLVQQTAYESLLAADRRLLHRTVGEALERSFGDRQDEAAEILAGHFERAGEAAKALHFTAIAAEQALRRFATAEAAGLFARAIELAAQGEFDEARVLNLYKQRGRALELGGDYNAALAVYRELEIAGREREVPRLELAAVIGAASLFAVPTPLFDPAEALSYTKRAMVLAEAIGDPAGQAKVYWLQLLVQTRLDPGAGAAAGEAGLALARRHGLREQEAFILNDIQADYQVLGHSDRALRALQEARPIWEELDNLPMLADNLASTAMLHSILAQYDLAVERSHESLAISERTGNLWGQSYGRVALGIAAFARGELGSAIREMSRCIDLSEQAGFVYPQTALRAMLAIVYGLAGDLDTAEALGTRSVDLSWHSFGQVSGNRRWLGRHSARRSRTGPPAPAESSTTSMGSKIVTLDSPIPLVMAIPAYHFARGDYAGALRSVDELIAAFEEFEWRSVRGPLLMMRGRSLKELGRSDEARDVFSTAYDEQRRQGLEAGLWEIEAELGQTAVDGGNLVEAVRWFRSAAAHLHQVAEGLTEHGLAERFLSQPHIQDILQKAEGQADKPTD
jgi:tetratricopeptide (TPR) repeat protein